MRDPRVEAFLNRGGWKWQYRGDKPEEFIPFEQIDIKYSSDNPARLRRKLDEERALRYAAEMQDGVEFPAIVLLTPSDRAVFPFDIATGVHRVHAADFAQKDPKKIDAYIVTETDRYRREVLIRMLNIVEGEGESLSEMIEHVIYLNATFGQTIPILCKEWHLKESTVRSHHRAYQGRERARKFGFDIDRGGAKLTIKLQGDMHSAIHSDRVFGDVCAFVCHHGPQPHVIADLLVNLKEMRDEEQAQKYVAKIVQEQIERAEREKRKTAKTQQGPAQKMIGNLVRFNRQLVKGIARLFLETLSESDVTKARANMSDAQQFIKAISAELDRIELIHRGHRDAA
jgi:hypothetical protein